MRLFELSQADPSPVIDFVLGWSDGPVDIDGMQTSLPTLNSNGEFELPSDRTWFMFRGYVADFPFDFASNVLVSSTVSIQRSGRGYWIKKV